MNRNFKKKLLLFLRFLFPALWPFSWFFLIWNCHSKVKTTFHIVAVYHPPDSSSFSNKFLICLLFVKYLWKLHSNEYHSLCAPSKQGRQEFLGSVWRVKKLLLNVVFGYVLMCGAKLACWNCYVVATVMHITQRLRHPWPNKLWRHRCSAKIQLIVKRRTRSSWIFDFGM